MSFLVRKSILSLTREGPSEELLSWDTGVDARQHIYVSAKAIALSRSRGLPFLQFNYSETKKLKTKTAIFGIQRLNRNPP